MTIMERLKMLMNDKNMRNNEFARNVGIPQSTFQTWLSRNEDFPARYVMPICHELNIVPELLLEGTERPKVDIPDDFMQLSEQERTLIEFVRNLDKEGMVVVTNKAVEEMRRVRSTQGNSTDARIG